jgi:hypothetical protein
MAVPMNTEWIIAALGLLVLIGGVYGWLWIGRHPDV